MNTIKGLSRSWRVRAVGLRVASALLLGGATFWGQGCIIYRLLNPAPEASIVNPPPRPAREVLANRSNSPRSSVPAPPLDPPTVDIFAPTVTLPQHGELRRVESRPADRTAPTISSSDSSDARPPIPSAPPVAPKAPSAEPKPAAPMSDAALVEAPATRPIEVATNIPVVSPPDVVTAPPPKMLAPVAPPSTSPAELEKRAKVEAMRARLTDGTDVNEKDEQGRTLLQQSALAGETEVANLLVDWGANVKDVDRQGWTALHWAGSSGHQEIAELLIASGADVNARGWLDDAPLYWSAVFDRAEVTELLIARGADVNVKDKRRKTPLHAAVEHDATKALAVLLAHGANLKFRDEDGLTPLHAAVQHCRRALQDLRSLAPDPLAASDAATHESSDAVLRKSAEVLKLLRAAGADVNSRTTRGLTALHLAASDEMLTLCEALLALGADVNARDTRERTPLAVAQERNQALVIKLLKSSGGEQ